jgi:acyl-CoA thioester hydrolase
MATSDRTTGRGEPATSLSNNSRVPSAECSRQTISYARVRYAETDKMGIVYYAHYLVWFEIGRTDWLRETGWSYRAMEDEGLALPVIEATCHYKAAARYDDEVEIRTRGRSVSALRIAFDYNIVRRSDGQQLAEGSTVHVTLDRTGRPVRLPARVAELFQ